MKTDIIITTWNCSECAELKSKINSSVIYDDDFIGKNGQHLSLIQAFSNTGTKTILNKFGFSEKDVTPVIFTYNSIRLSEFEEILSYLKEQGFLNVEKSRN